MTALNCIGYIINQNINIVYGLILFHIKSYYITLYKKNIILNYIMVYYIKLYYIILYGIILYYITLYYTVLHCIVLYYIILYCIYYIYKSYQILFGGLKVLWIFILFLVKRFKWTNSGLMAGSTTNHVWSADKAIISYLSAPPNRVSPSQNW